MISDSSDAMEKTKQGDRMESEWELAGGHRGIQVEERDRDTEGGGAINGEK